MQQPHGAKGTLQGLGFAESMVNTFEQSAKFYWRMWGPLGEPMVRTVDAWADIQRGYLQWLRETSVSEDMDVTQRIAREAQSSFTQMAREAERSATEAQRIARDAQRDATTEAAEEEEAPSEEAPSEEAPSEEISSVVRESVRRSEEGSREEEPQDTTTTDTPDLEESRADAAEGLPIEDYDSLNVQQVTQRLGELSVEQIEQLRDYEAENRNRSSLMQRFESRINRGGG